MAGDWIKMRSNLWDDPRVTRIVDMTDSCEAAVVGALYWLWSAADQHSTDGVMNGLSIRGIDRKTGIKGFGDALVAIGWIADHPEGVRIVNFDDHNGASAKKRCETARRVSKHRSGNCDVTQEALQDEHESVTDALAREREEIEEIPSLSSAVPMPPIDQQKPKREKPIPPCPHEALIDLFAQRLPELPQPVKSLWADGKNGAATKSRWAWVMTACHEHGERKGQRLAQTTEDALAWFDRYFRYVGKSDFLTGRKGEWMADMGWLMAKANFEKVISGSYENKLEAA